MADVVLKLPIREGEEAQLFGSYLNRSVESRSFEAERMAEFSDAPYLMVRSDPGFGEDVKVLIFQERRVASDFSSGWNLMRTRPALRRA